MSKSEQQPSPGEAQTEELSKLQSLLTERDREVAELRRELAAKDAHIAQLRVKAGLVSEDLSSDRATGSNTATTLQKLRQTEASLRQEIIERKRAHEELNASRIAALNLMEDAIAAQKQLQQANIALQKEISDRKHADQALLQANERLETIFSNTHVKFALLDTGFNFIRVNRAYAVADERIPDFFPGKNHFALYPNAENQLVFQKVLQTGEPYTALAKPFQYPEHPERGTSYWDWTLYPIKSGDGIVTTLLLSLLDVTERIHAEEGLHFDLPPET